MLQSINRGRHRFALVLILAALLVLTHRGALAHGGAVVIDKSGWITLGPQGNATAIYHQFGFVLALGDSLRISYNVSQGSQDVVNFQIHDHIGNLTKVFLNVTRSELVTVLNVTLDGYYMPQWVNSNPRVVGLAYSVATVHPAPTPLFLQTPFLILVAAVPSAAGLIWWRGKRAKARRSNSLHPPPEP